MINDRTMQSVLKKLEQNLSGRKVVFYGKDLKMKEYLESKGYSVEKIFTADPKLIEDISYPCYPYQELSGKKDEYYVILPYLLNDGGKLLSQRMEHMGFLKDKDYSFCTEIMVTGIGGHYEDIHGNEIIGNCGKIRVFFFGRKNRVVIDDNLLVDGSLEIFCKGNDNKISIEKSCRFFGSNKIIFVENKSEILIEKNCRFIGIQTRIFGNSYLKIGEDSSFGEKTSFNLPAYTKISIDKDCMFSWGIQVMSTDGHSIFDLHTKDNINSNHTNLSEGEYLGQVEVGEHVWCGEGATILGGGITRIGNGSIIGAESVVKGIYSNNVILAGIPAKVIRKDIAWSRANNATDIAACNGYTDFTEEIE